MGSVPAAMRCFYESDSYESFLRNVFRLKCDSDTLAAIGGAVAEEYYGWTGFYNEDELLKKYLDANLYNLVKLWFATGKGDAAVEDIFCRIFLDDFKKKWLF